MVANLSAVPTQSQDIKNLHRVFEAQRAAFGKHRYPSAAERIAHLNKLREALAKWKDTLATEVSKDFGHRSKDETLFAEVMTSLEGIKYNAKNVRKWMQADKRHVTPMQQPAKAKVVYQPVGVVGVVVPWNYPIFLATGPLTAALAAGNRVMIKMSSFTPALGEAFRKMIAENFSEDHVCVINGKGEISDAFSRLPFDHILFTGSTAVGRQIMSYASANLTPVTLELGGKSPTIIHESFPIKDAVPRIAFGKCWNAGQTCVAPDHLLCPRGKVDEFVREFTAQVGAMYPSGLLNNPDYTSVVNEKQYTRIQGYLQDAREKGAKIIEINPTNETFENTRKMPVTLALNVTEDMELMKNEIFGPVLPIIPYDSLDEAINYVNSHPRPLAFYYFDYNSARAEFVETHTHSGGMCINDTLSHVGVDDLPFGGVGPAGMGRYHGKEGFMTLSNARAVLHKPKFYPVKYFLPPFNSKLHDFIKNNFLK
ncbi:MAG: coniferyl aldehyde dehydrogenase [Gammaproteobacteria bacterium]